MQVLYGNYAHPVNEAAPQITIDPQRSEGNQYYAYKVTWVIRGYLLADTQNNLLLLIAALEAGYSRDGGDLVLLANDGSTIAASLLARNCIGGTRVTGGVKYPDDGQNSNEFGTYRKYEITVEGLVKTRIELLAWAEGFDRMGGGPRDLFLQPLLQLPQKQRVAQATPYKLVQHGRAVGMTGYPDPPPPRWPADVHWDQIQIKDLPPKRYGPPGAPVYIEWERTWSYPYEATGPFLGNPTLWPF